MNKRIEKLLAQAHIEFAPDSKAVTSRFADLVVKECLKLCIEVEGDLNILSDSYFSGKLLDSTIQEGDTVKCLVRIGFPKTIVISSYEYYSGNIITTIIGKSNSLFL